MKIAKLIVYLGFMLNSNVEGVLNINAQNKGDLSQAKTTYVLYNPDIEKSTNHDVYQALAKIIRVPEDMLRVFSKSGQFVKNDENFTSGLESGIKFEIIPEVNLVALELDLRAYAMNYVEFVDMKLDNKIKWLKNIKDFDLLSSQAVGPVEDSEATENPSVGTDIRLYLKNFNMPLGMIFPIKVNYRRGITTGRELYESITNSYCRAILFVRAYCQSTQKIAKLLFNSEEIPNDDEPLNIDLVNDSILYFIPTVLAVSSPVEPVEESKAISSEPNTIVTIAGVLGNPDEFIDIYYEPGVTTCRQLYESISGFFVKSDPRETYIMGFENKGEGKDFRIFENDDSICDARFTDGSKVFVMKSRSKK